MYPTNEHVPQAAKTFGPAERERIRLAVSPASAKKLGQRVALRSDWEDVKYGIMEQLVRVKFAAYPLRSKLMSTGNAEFIEGNHWRDRTWGCTRDPSAKWVWKNWLGKALMVVRAEVCNQP